MTGTTQAQQAMAGRPMWPGAVTVDFSGIFTVGSYAGTAFSGRIHYHPATPPSEQHISFATFDDWPAPIATIAVGGNILTADGAAVYDSIFDGGGSHYDFVTMYGTGPFNDFRAAAFCEFYFADDDASTLDGTRMPTIEQLQNFPVKQLSFGTDAPGNVISTGDMTLCVGVKV